MRTLGQSTLHVTFLNQNLVLSSFKDQMCIKIASTYRCKENKCRHFKFIDECYLAVCAQNEKFVRAQKMGIKMRFFVILVCGEIVAKNH